MRSNADHSPFEPSEIQAAVSPVLLRPLPASVYPLLARYLELLTRWNQKISLTSVRDPDVLVRLHLAECLRAAQQIPKGVTTVLDFGSGAGFPGIPIQIAHPEMRVTLSESQRKKAAFLQEAIRELRLSGASVHSGRVDAMPPSSQFDMVTLRAVDKMEEAMRSAVPRIRPTSGHCMVLTSRSQVAAVSAYGSNPASIPILQWEATDPIPGTEQRVILIGSRVR